MIGLTHPATGHQVSTDEASVQFWQAAGYRLDEPKPKAAKKAPAKKSSTSRKSSK